VVEVVASGVDLVSISGDKLLGGPQAGILVGTAPLISCIRQHPLMRAVRPDKLTLAALCATLALYRDGRAGEIPTVAMLSATPDDLRVRAEALGQAIRSVLPPDVAVEVAACLSTVGGGAMPLAQLPSWAVTVAWGGGTDRLEAVLRTAAVPVIARVEDRRVWLDVRTIAPEEQSLVVAALSGHVWVRTPT
jgi:L-seryl-tRNA(Ser) seleniumtransferase